MADYEVHLILPNPNSVPSWDWCTSPSKENGEYGLTPPVTTLRLSHMDRVHETGIPGVGIRITPVSGLNDRFFYTQSIPFTLPTPETSPTLKPPIRLKFEFIRTAMGVGKGDLTFNYETQFFIDTHQSGNPKVRVRSHHRIVGTSLKTTLQQNVYFTSCHTTRTPPPVEMGRTMIAEIKLGQVKEHAFSLDVQCEGMNPATKPPVKVYFEGDAIRSVLNLDNSRATHVAKGVGIAVTDDKGNSLPFTKQGAMSLKWQSSDPNVERYRFSGQARYVATTGEMTAGKADATLKYILQYE
ncbi:fimbrial protein [Pseudomonas sp. R2.Fl]|nr:fimbrial protein [Pseudomonas sp. R2.Fl]